MWLQGGAKGVPTVESRRGGRAALAADGRHRPGGLTEALLSHVVLQLLAPHRVADQGLEFVIARTAAERFAQVGLVKREEAGAELALGRQPYAVAVRAERLGDRVDEADLALAVGEAEDACSRRGLARQFLERVDRIDHRAQLL